MDISPLIAEDHDAWFPLWNANNLGHADDTVTRTTWARLMDPGFPVCGLAARADDHLAGFLHYILHPVTGSLHPACYMQDLFVDPGFRRRGTARALVNHLAALGKREGWARLYWLADANSREAQALYKNLGVKVEFTLHLMPL